MTRRTTSVSRVSPRCSRATGFERCSSTSRAAVVVDAIRRTIDVGPVVARRGAGRRGGWTAAVANAVDDATRRSLRRVINATGVVLHTNLGRAPLAAVALDAIDRVARGFSNLEYDVARGERGSRYSHCAALLRELTGAEDALVVNNCAAALVLVLNTLADGRTAIVSRGELIEIGGSFRIPDIMEQERRAARRSRHDESHAPRRLSTRAGSATARSSSRSTAATSRSRGFVADVSASRARGARRGPRRAGAARPRQRPPGVARRRTDCAASRRRATRCETGASIVTMSGDKLLGGPQAGLILGSRRIIDRIRKNPLTRSYRVDKLTLAALEATLALYRDPARAIREIPALAQLTADVATLTQRANRLAAAHRGSARERGRDAWRASAVARFPRRRFRRSRCAVDAPADEVERRLRGRDPAVVARIADGMRAARPANGVRADEEELVRAVRAALEAASA